jgi:murein DD-endopeptidase MepM/ murein hydrolase activator NlpD
LQAGRLTNGSGLVQFTGSRLQRKAIGKKEGVNFMKPYVFVPILVVAVMAAIFAFFWSTSGPALSLTPAAGPVSAGRGVVAQLEAPRGLRKLTVAAIQGERTVTVLLKEYPAARETFSVAQAGLQEGPFTLQVEAAGSSIFGLPGRTTSATLSFTYDNTPPVVAVMSAAHNIIRGGAGLVVYTVAEEVEKTGVVVGDRFFPGYRQAGNFYACLFPFPYNMTPEQYVPKVVAVDRAGNERLAGINFHLLVKPFSTDRINLSDALLAKVSAEFGKMFPQAKTPLEIFLKANGELRAQNLKALYDFARQTSPTPLWQGDFLRMPNSAPLGGFAQTRTYLHQGQQVDLQTHLGFDLASVAQAPVPAANRGKVVHAGDLGIYGQCIIIDHGLGLQTLYGHLSRMAVKAGESVEKGQVIGNTGATGMAAGDHLHFGVTVSGQEVNPLEWWDRSWIKNNVAGKLEMIK